MTALLLFSLLLLLFLLPLSGCFFASFSWRRRECEIGGRKRLSFLSLEESNVNLDDWRDFRSKLIQSNSNSSMDVFDAGDLIEAGSIVLSEVESSLCCHDLNQPYLHKAVVLLLEHSDTTFTKGVILNRPTDLVLSDDDIVYLNDNGEPIENESGPSDENVNQWRMNFGGDLASFHSENPMIVCLHCLTESELARQLSDPILPGIYYTSHDSAKRLIAHGDAQTVDFFVCCGYCGWDPGQLAREIKRGSWSMVSTTRADVIRDVLKQPKEHLSTSRDPRMAGIPMWESFRVKVGRDAHLGRGLFSDLMLKEWATEMLCLARKDEDDYFCDDQSIVRTLNVAKYSPVIEAGMLLRSSSRHPSPFLLLEHMLHRATILVFHETDEVSVGLILNHPTTETFVLNTPNGKNVEFTIRYGGASGIDGKDPLVWLHCSRSLRKLGIGSSLNKELGSLIWTCTPDDVAEAIDLQIAIPAEFLVVQGFSVWEKEVDAGGIPGLVLAGDFEAVSSSQVENTWSLLQSQRRLTKDTLGWNIQTVFNAWIVAGLSDKTGLTPSDDSSRLVYDSNTTVGDLANEALLNWVDIYLLGDSGDVG